MRRFLNSVSTLWNVRSFHAHYAVAQQDARPPRKIRRGRLAQEGRTTRVLRRKTGVQRPIYLHANSVGPGIIDYVPELQPTLHNWIRVSASVPREAQQFIAVFSALLPRFPEIPRLKLISGETTGHGQN